MRIRPSILAIGILLVAVGCTNDEQMKRVEQEVGDLKVEVFKMRQQVEELNRRSESDRAALAEGRTQDRRFQADLQDTMRQLQDATRVLGNRVNDLSRKPASGNTSPQPSQAPAVGGEEQAFNALMLDYNRGSYEMAAENFEQFLTNNPKSTKRADALYYLGFSHYNLRAYDKAMRAFDRLIKEHAASDLFLASKFKRAMCQLKLGLKAAAIASFQDLAKNFPDTPEGRNAAQELADL